MKTAIYKSLVILSILMLTVSFTSCSKGSGIVDPTDNLEQTPDMGQTNLNQNGDDLGINTDLNGNTGN